MNNQDSVLTKMTKQILKEFIYGGHLTALGAVGIILTVTQLFNKKIDILTLIIPYFIPLIVYNFNHYKELFEDKDSNPERTNHLSGKVNKIKTLLILYTAILFTITIILNVKLMLLVLFIILGGLMYTLYFKPLCAKYFAGFKNFYISFFWCLLVFIIPLLHNEKIQIGYILIAIFIFLRGIVNSAFCDIKDIKTDKESNLKTFPVLLGKNKTLFFLHIINILSIVPIIIGVKNQNINQAGLSLTLTVLYDLIYLIPAFFINNKKLRTFTYIIVDSECIFWPLLIYFGNLIH